MTSERVIARGFGEHSDPAALVVGPTGLALGRVGDAVRRRQRREPHRAVPDALTRDHRGVDGAHRHDERAR